MKYRKPKLFNIYWLSATTKITSMSLGTQTGFFTDQSNAPNNTT